MIAWEMIKEIIPVEVVTKRNESELSIVLCNGSVIELKGADNEDSLRGVGVSFVVLDEFADMKHNVWHTIIRPMLTDTKGRALFIGTPKGQNHFYELYLKGMREEDEFKSFKFLTVDNPFIDPEEVLKAKAEMPKTFFEQEYECAFITDEDKVLITSAMLDKLKDGIHFNDTREIIAVDPAMGGDECVIYVMRNYEIVHELILYERDTMKITGEISVLCGKFNINDVAIDCIGIGIGIADRLREIGKKVLYINSAERATMPDQFANVRAEIWFHLFDLVSKARVPRIQSTELIRQLTAVRFEIQNSMGKIALEPKKKTKELLGRSPDKADAFVYGCWGLSQVKPVKVQDRYAEHAARLRGMADDNNLFGGNE